MKEAPIADSKAKTVFGMVAAAFLGGGCLALAFPTYDVWPLAFLALTFPLLGAHGRGWKAHFFTGWLFSTFIYLLGFTWIFHTLRVFAYMSFPMASLGLIVFAVAHGLVGGVWLLLVGVLKKHTKLPYWILAPLLYVPLEHFSPALFPWQLGCPLLHTRALVQCAEFGGAGLLSFVVALSGGALADFLLGAKRGETGWRHRQGLLVLLGLLLVFSAYGAVRLQGLDALMNVAKKKGRVVRIGVAQPNIGIYEKEGKGGALYQVKMLKKMSRKAVKKGAELLVWPETALQISLDHQEVLAEIRISPENNMNSPVGQAMAEWVLPQEFVFGWTPVITGGLTEKKTEKGFVDHNVAFFVEPFGKLSGVTVKKHLVPFGEYLPLEKKFPSLREHFPHAGNMEAGKDPQVLHVHGMKVGVPICYEDIIASFTRQLARKGIHIFINLTNDSWFGDGREPYQHLALAALRTIETRRAMVRATNTGVSALIDPTGRIQKRTSTFSREVMVGTLPLLTGKTFFVEHGPWVVYLCVVLLVFAGLVSFKNVGTYLRRWPRSQRKKRIPPSVDLQKSEVFGDLRKKPK